MVPRPICPLGTSRAYQSHQKLNFSVKGLFSGARAPLTGHHTLETKISSHASICNAAIRAVPGVEASYGPFFQSFRFGVALLLVRPHGDKALARILCCCQLLFIKGRYPFSTASRLRRHRTIGNSTTEAVRLPTTQYSATMTKNWEQEKDRMHEL